MIHRILITQEAPVFGKSPYLDVAEKYGVEVAFHSFVKVEKLDEKLVRKQIINPEEYNSIIFTSRAAIDAYFRFAEMIHFNVSEKIHYYCPNEGVAKYLQKYSAFRKRKVFAGTTKLKDIESLIAKYKAEKFLLMIADTQREEVCSLLDTYQIDYRICISYEVKDNPLPEDASLDYDVILFSNASSVSAMMRLNPNFQQGTKIIGGAGDKTIQAIKEAGLRLDIEAPKDGILSLPEALDVYLKEHK